MKGGRASGGGGGGGGGGGEAEGKLSQEQVTLMAAVRSCDCGDRGSSGCNASKGA